MKATRITKSILILSIVAASLHGVDFSHVTTPTVPNPPSFPGSGGTIGGVFQDVEEHAREEERQRREEDTRGVFRNTVETSSFEINGTNDNPTPPPTPPTPPSRLRVILSSDSHFSLLNGVRPQARLSSLYDLSRGSNNTFYINSLPCYFDTSRNKFIDGIVIPYLVYDYTYPNFARSSGNRIVVDDTPILIIDAKRKTFYARGVWRSFGKVICIVSGVIRNDIQDGNVCQRTTGGIFNIHGIYMTIAEE